MPNLKIFGAALFIAATSLLGRRLAASVELTVQIITDLIFALQMLESEIAFSINPLFLASERVAKDAKTQAVAECFSSFASGLKQSRDSTKNLWLSVVSQVLGGYPLADKDLQLIGRLGDQLGLSNREDQVKHIKQVRIALENSLTQAKEECQRYKGLYRKIGVTLGLIIVLLTW